MIAPAKPTRRKRGRRQRPLRGDRPRSLTQPTGWVDRLAGWFDRGVYFFSPTAGARRIATRQAFRLGQSQIQRLETRHDRRMSQRQERLAHYEGADESDRTRGNRWLASRLSPEDGLEQDHETLRRNANELYRGDCHAHAAIERRVDNEIGVGIHPQSRVRAVPGVVDEKTAAEINNRLEDLFERVRDSIDRTRTDSIEDVQELIDRTWADQGECFVQLADVGDATSPIPLILDVIHPSRVETPPEEYSNPRVRLGVKYDAAGRIVGYYVRNKHPDESKDVDHSYKFIPRLDKKGQPRMLHLLDRMFPRQSRGLPWLTAAINKLKDVKDTNEAELLAIEIEACFVAFVKGQAPRSPLEQATGAASATDAAGNRLEDLQPGMIEYVGDGDVQFGNPNRPGSTFPPFMERQLRTVAACAGMPYELLAGDFFRTTFSSARASLIQGWKGFRRRQHKIIRKILRPFWRRMVVEAILVGELDGLITAEEFLAHPTVFSRHEWIPPGRELLDPPKEIGASLDAIEGGLSCVSDEISATGRDPEQVAHRRFEERQREVEERVALEVLEQKLRQRAGLTPKPQESEADEPAGETADQMAAELVGVS